MAISTSWPRLRWPIQSGAVDPGGRWVWHTRPRIILPLWEPALARRFKIIGPDLKNPNSSTGSAHFASSTSCSEQHHQPLASIGRSTSELSKVNAWT